jgi:hypothetical protein
MGGAVKVESEGIGHGTTFVIQMQATSKIPEVLAEKVSSSQNLEPAQNKEAKKQEVDQLQKAL